MSRTRKKSPRFSWGMSDKKSKKKCNRAFRLAVKRKIRNGDYDHIPSLRSVYNTYDFIKEGKYYMSYHPYTWTYDFHEKYRMPGIDVYHIKKKGESSWR